MPYFIQRTYPRGVRSCGGPYGSRTEASQMASRFAPSNQRSVAILDERQDPEAEPGRPWLMRLRPAASRWRHVVVGPFRSRKEARRFLGEAFAPVCRAGDQAHRPLGTASDWEEVQVSLESSPNTAGRWEEDGRVQLRRVVTDNT